MRKILVNLLVLTLLCGSSVMAQFSGSGTESDPYLITSDQDLQNFANSVNAGNPFLGKFFLQTADIDLVESQIFSDGFVPIGDFYGNKPFSGTYDGGGHSILKMVIVGSDKVAMFTNLQNGCIKNLNLENLNFTANGYSNVSGLVAVASNSTISNVTVSGQLSASGEMTEIYFAGMVGQATRTSISGSLCMLTVDIENAQFNTCDIAGIAKCDSRTTVTDCFVSTFINSHYSNYYPIIDNGTATRCLLAESYSNPSSVAVIYNNCYFDHQNTILAEYPMQQTFTEGFEAKTTAELISGSVFGNANWTETAGLYPRPAAVANTNAAILAASPMMLSSTDCVANVASNFTVSTANGVAWDSESTSLQISGGNVSLLSFPNSEVEIYAYRNNLVKNLMIGIGGDELGSKTNPIRISNEEDLLAFAETPNTNKYFLLDSDIVVTSAWNPIEFSGHFDGGNHTITFTYEPGDYNSYMAGFFTQIAEATICNLNLVCNIVVDGYGYAGALATYAHSSVISNCTVSGQIYNYFYPEDMGYCGGFVARAANTAFYKCVNMADIEIQSGQVGLNTGGIVGDGTGLLLRSCTNLGNISGYPDQGAVGGIIGEADSVTIVSCANYVSFTCQDYEPGGIAGNISQSTVTDCANYGDNPLVEMTHVTYFANNIIIPASASFANDAENLSYLMLSDGVGGGYYHDGTYSGENNHTDKQIVPISGNDYNIDCLLTSELISGTGLDASKWILNSGRYPIPVETVTDHDFVKLATTPFVLGATDSENYQTINNVSSDITLGSADGVSWMFDSVPVTGNLIDIDLWQHDTEKVTKTLSIHVGDTLYRSYEITILPRLGVPENPLLIESLSDFNEFAGAISQSNGQGSYKGVAIENGGAGLSFRLTADIEAQQGSTNVVRVSQINGFSGILNGGGHTITVSTNDLVANSFCALFPYISDAKIDSLNIVVNGDVDASNITETNENYLAILCSEAYHSTISNCTVTLDGTFTGNNGALICGLLKESRLINCATLGSGSISLGGAGVAGIVNYSQNSRIINCTNNVNINTQGSSTVSGGIVAKAYSLILENCTNNADVINANSDYYVYSAGIVGMLEGDGSPNLDNIIRNAVNNGDVEAITGDDMYTYGVAAGIVAGYNTSSENAALVKVEKCVNSGYIEGGNAAAGIAYQIEGEVSNCANYGEIKSSGHIAGVNCMEGNSITVGNIEVGRVINKYNYYNDYTENLISPYADEDDFFDSEITEIRVDSLRINFNTGGSPRTTRQMVGSELANELPGDWDFAENLYPLPAGLDTNDARNKLARLPIILMSEGRSRCEYMTSVISDFILPQVEGVTWVSSHPDIVSVPSGGGVATVTNPETDSNVTITATCEGFSKTYTITVHRARGTSADDPIIISSRSAFEELGVDSVYQSYCYGLYFRLGNSLQLSRAVPYFNGHFDGGGYTITWGNNTNNKCLFYDTNGAEISNLSTYGSNTALIDNAKETTIRNCVVYTDISSGENAGGLVGESSDGTLIDGCIVAGNIVTKHSGGFVSNAKDTRIVNSISMISANNPSGAEQEDVAAFVFSGTNIVVDSCLAIGSYLRDISSFICPSIGNEGSSIYYDRQQWNISEGVNSLSAIGKTSRELVGNGIFAGSAKWVHTDGKYPVPAGTENFTFTKLVSAPMLIGENDPNVMEVSSLGISPEQVEGEVLWSAQSDSGITADLTISCVDEPRPAEIVATIVDTTSTTYTFTRPIEVTKGIVTDYPYSPDLCEGFDLIMPVPNYGEAIYQWSVEPELQIDEIGTDSIAVRIPIDFFASRALSDSLINLTLTITFDGCEKTQNFEFNVLPSPEHVRLNDTSVCLGSELTLSCYADEGYEACLDRLTYSWLDGEENPLFGPNYYYIPSLVADKNITVVVTGCTAVSIPVVVSANEAAPITVVSGEPDQQICEGELMEPIVLSVPNATYTVPEGIYTDYDTASNQLTLSGRPHFNSQGDYSYTIYGCGSSLSGTVEVTERMYFPNIDFSRVVDLGERITLSMDGCEGLENLLTWESIDGSETFTSMDLGLTVMDVDGSDILIGTPEMPGEYICHINVPATGACPAVTYDNFLGIYETEELVATALDPTLCEGETATLATVERPGAYGGDYVWTLDSDTVGTGSRIDLIPPVGTSTYEVSCGGKRMVGEFEVGDYIVVNNGAYITYKNWEWHRTASYMIVNIEEDSLLLMSRTGYNNISWTDDVPEIPNYATVSEAITDMNGRENFAAANEQIMIGDNFAYETLGEGFYVPSAGEIQYIIDNYEKFYLEFDENNYPTICLSTEKDANNVYVLNTNYGFIIDVPREYLTNNVEILPFMKIAKSDIIEMHGRTSNISRTASVNVIVKERQDMSISTDDVLCNTDTARVGINTGYEVVNWYNVTNPEAEIMYDEDLAVLTEGTYIAVGTYELGACYDTLEVKVKDLAFYIPQDTTVCDSAILTIAKEDVIVMIDGEAIEGQTLVLTETGTYTIALVGVGDTCREEKILNLTVNPSYSISFDTIVYDSTFVWNEETYTATGNYTQFFTTNNGCDSIVTANVTFVNTETEFALFGIVTEGDGTTPLADVEVSSEGTTVTTSNDGSYLIMIQRTNPVVHFSKQGYNIICDSVSGGGEYNVSMFKPEISVSLSDDSYETSPYVMRQVVVELSNSGDGPLAWSSVVESDFTASDRAVHPRSNSQMWEYADEVIVTNSNAEQAIATDGFYIYTASWRRAGEFNRYSPDNGYLETFVIDGVGGVRNLSYGNGLFFATDNTNKIYIINMDTQSLEDVITLNDPDLQIRYCTYSTEEDLLYIGNWTNLYKLVAYNTAYPTMIPLSYSMDNVYSIAYDAFSGSEPCLWAFSQVSENNGPFAKLYKLNKNGVQIAEMEHYINDESLASPSSLAGGICVSQNLYDDKYVLLANIQNSNARNNIAVYEIGGKSSWVSTNTKGGVIPAGESINVVVTELAMENGNYSAVVKFKPNVYMPQNTELNLSLAVSSPACSPVENLVAETDTFHVVNLSWDVVDAGDYESVSYLVYEQGSNVAIDTVQTTSYSVENAEVGNHCYYVRAFMRGETDCVSEASNTACAEILAFPCDVQLSLTARAFGDRIRLEWNELFGVDHYEVHVDDLTGVILYNGSETIFEDTLALPETNNCYEVVAYFRNEECGSKRSNTACARISADGCSELPVVTATAVGNSVVLSWGKIQGIQSYSLYKDDKYITSTSDTVFYDMMLEYETEYCYVVEINCGYGMFGLSDEVCVTTEKEYEEQNAIESITNESIDIYPNPASDRFFVDGQQMQGLQIVNFAGQVVYELDNISEDRLMIDASAFAPGVYAVRIILSDSRSVVKQIVIGR